MLIIGTLIAALILTVVIETIHLWTIFITIYGVLSLMLAFAIAYPFWTPTPKHSIEELIKMAYNKLMNKLRK